MYSHFITLQNAFVQGWVQAKMSCCSSSYIQLDFVTSVYNNKTTTAANTDECGNSLLELFTCMYKLSITHKNPVYTRALQSFLFLSTIKSNQNNYSQDYAPSLQVYLPWN